MWVQILFSKFLCSPLIVSNFTLMFSTKFIIFNFFTILSFEFYFPVKLLYKSFVFVQVDFVIIFYVYILYIISYLKK